MTDPVEVVMARNGKVYLGRRGKAEGQKVGWWMQVPRGGWVGWMHGDPPLHVHRTTKHRLRDWFMDQTRDLRRQRGEGEEPGHG